MRSDVTVTPLGKDYLAEYLSLAPISFGLNRAIECRVLSGLCFEHPVLDVGCGDGLFAEVLFGRRGLDVGMDLSVSELRRAADRASYRALISADGGNIPFVDGSFNTILCNSVLEHIPDLEKALLEVARVLRPEGNLIVTVPTEGLSRQFFYSQLLARLGFRRLADLYAETKNRVWRHRHMYSIEEWEGKLQAAGLVVEARLPMATARAMSLCDLFFPLAAPSAPLKRLNRRLTVRPRFTGKLIARLLRGVYLTDDATSASICFVSRKRAN